MALRLEKKLTFELIHTWSVTNVLVSCKNICLNKTVLNFDENINDIKLITPLQLLYLNTGESYPFADRLIEYLVGNAITPLDTLGDNIKRVKTTVVRQAGKDSGIIADYL